MLSRKLEINVRIADMYSTVANTIAVLLLSSSRLNHRPLNSLKKVQVRQLLELLHTLIVSLDYLLIIEQQPLTVNPDVGNVMTRVD